MASIDDTLVGLATMPPARLSLLRTVEASPDLGNIVTAASTQCRIGTSPPRHTIFSISSIFPFDLLLKASIGPSARLIRGTAPDPKVVEPEVVGPA